MKLKQIDNKGNRLLFRWYHVSKSALIILIVTFFNISTNAYSQQKKISITQKNVTVKEVLKQIEKQSDYTFLYKNDNIDGNRIVSIDLKEKPVEILLNQLFKGTKVTYEIVNKQIVLVDKVKDVPKTETLPKNVTGKISDPAGEPLFGVSIYVIGSNKSTISDINGTYSISNILNEDIIRFSFLGMETQDIQVGNKNAIDVIMEDNTISLNEVVAVGYGFQKKVNLTGSVSSISFSQLTENRPVMNAASAIAGTAAGVQVLQSTGKPGSESESIRIRGVGTLNTNSPLVLVDGIQYDMNVINPNDIESISILKDAASAAIYGSRAANGVVLVTTKKGKGKPKAIYSGFGTFQTPQNKLSFVSYYVEHMELINEASFNIGNGPIFSQNSIDTWRAAKENPNGLNEYGALNYMAYPNTNWFNEIFSTGFSQDHNISVSGSSKDISYLISAGYLNNEGIMNKNGLDSGFERYTFRTNVEGKVNNWLTLGSRIFGLTREIGMANTGNGFDYLYKTTPGIWPGTPNKLGIPACSEESTNANNIFEKMTSRGYNKSYRASLTLYGKIDLLKGLSLEPSYNFSPDFAYYNTYGFQHDRWNYVENIPENLTDIANAAVRNSTTTKIRNNAEVLLKYNTTIKDKHSIGALAGYSTSYYSETFFDAKKKGMSSWNLVQLSAITNMVSADGTKTDWGLRSWFGRVNYAYNDRYLFEANIRYDGSSRFAPESRWGIFPSFSSGWRISEESFMTGTKDLLSNLKLRASWGEMGNNSSGNYAWQASYSTDEVVVNGVPSTGLYISKLGNSSLEWETTTTTDIGLDFSLFKNHLSGTLDWYNKFTEGILFTPTLYMTMGEVSGSTENIAAVRNRGLELTLSWQDKIGDVRYAINANVSFNKNLVTKYKGQLQKYWILDDDGNKVSYFNNMGDVLQSGFGGQICEGHAIGETYIRQLYKGSGNYNASGSLDINAGPKDGMIRTESDMAWVQAMIGAGYKFVGVSSVSKDQLWYGDLIYADSNENGNYGDSDDQNLSGHTNQPKYNVGLSTSVSYKGFDFNTLWAGSAGFTLYWHHSYYNGTMVQNGFSIMENIANDHYFYDPNDPTNVKTNINATYPRLTYATENNNSLASNFWEYKGDFLKLKNAQLGYTLPSSLTKKIKVEKFRVYVSGENLLTWTDFHGLDPEIGTEVDYPLVKQYAFGAQITF